MDEERLKQIEENQKKIIGQNKKIINILSGTNMETEAAYEDIKEMAKKSPHGITRKQAAAILDIHANNVGTHFEKISNSNEHFHVSEDTNRKGHPEILVYNRAISSDTSVDSKSEKSRRQNLAWL